MREIIHNIYQLIIHCILRCIYIYDIYHLTQARNSPAQTRARHQVPLPHSGFSFPYVRTRPVPRIPIHSCPGGPVMSHSHCWICNDQHRCASFAQFPVTAN